MTSQPVFAIEPALAAVVLLHQLENSFQSLVRQGVGRLALEAGVVKSSGPSRAVVQVIAKRVQASVVPA
jgi:hypothetical protein